MVVELLGKQSQNISSIKPQLGNRSTIFPYLRSNNNPVYVDVLIEIRTRPAGGGEDDWVLNTKRYWEWTNQEQYNEGTKTDNIIYKEGGIQLGI